MKRLVARLPGRAIRPLIQTHPPRQLPISTPFGRAQSRSQINSIRWSPVVLTPPPGSPEYPPTTHWSDRYDGEWTEEGGGVGPDGKIHLVGLIAFRCTETECSEARWEEFKKKFEKLMLIQWEHEGSEGADPGDTRKYFKIFWVEEKEVLEGKQGVDLTLLRRHVRMRRDYEPEFDADHDQRRFEKMINVRQWHKLHENSDKSVALISPALNTFLYVNDEAISSLLDIQTPGNIPFAYAVAPDHPDVHGKYSDDDPMDPDGHYKIAIELLGWFWLWIGLGMRGMECTAPKVIGGVTRTIMGAHDLYEDLNLHGIKEKFLN
ncbi:uncharacterized protein PAC_02596 [Phialocephala subalpina]|uniref:Uncharacterized protein n=1 Tax=Phialocephala subalpina TaxID=576137 RepID=A0A1L7WIW9_9HELO|nr:uncharacterized protein PAC_02596 [Phialocephala subalpina]